MNKSKKNNFFPIIIALIILFFSTIIFLSIPVLFNYKSIERQIEKRIYSTFNINLKILDEVNYQFIPLPHLLIKKANLKLDSDDGGSTIIKTKENKIPLEKLTKFFKNLSLVIPRSTQALDLFRLI